MAAVWCWASHALASLVGACGEAVAQSERAERIGAEAEGVRREPRRWVGHTQGAQWCAMRCLTQDAEQCWTEQHLQPHGPVHMHNVAGRAGVVPERAAPRTVHVIESACEVVEVHTKRVGGDALLAGAQQLALSDTPARCGASGPLAAAETRTRTRCASMDPAVRHGSGGMAGAPHR